MTTLRFAGLDTSLSACGVVNAAGRCLTVRPNSGGDLRARLDQLVRGVVMHLRAGGGVDIAGVEGYNPGGIQGVTMAKLGAARELICLELWRANVLIVDLPPKSIKLYATGKGNADKPTVWDAAVAASPDGLEPRTHDEGDAWWARQLVMAKYQPLHVDLVDVTAEQQRAIDGIRWPKLPSYVEAGS